MLHHAAAGAFADVDHRVDHAAAHIHLVQFPVEQRLVERLGLADIGRREFDMNKRVCHGALRVRLFIRCGLENLAGVGERSMTISVPAADGCMRPPLR
jgi:hypothetical protein